MVNIIAAAATAKSPQLCPTLCDPRDGSPAGSPVPGILQARTLEWVAISLSNAWKWKGKVKSLSRVRLLATPRTAAHQAPPSMGFSRQEYWSRMPIKHLKNDLSLDWDWRYISLGGGCISSSENRASPGAWNTLTAVHSAEMDLWCGHPGAPQSIPLIKLLELPHQEKLKRTPCPKQTI